MAGEMNLRTRIYIAAVIACGTWAVFRALWQWHSDDLLRFVSMLAVCLLVSGLKVNLPGIKGTMSVNFLFILYAVNQMTLSEAVTMACLGTLVQCLWKPKKSVKAVRLAFSMASMAMAVSCSYAFCGFLPTRNSAVLLMAAAVVFFF